MLLAIDAGNTNVTVGVFSAGELRERWRMRTIRDQTEDEWGTLIRNLFSLSGLDPSEISGVIVSSVVPAIDPVLDAMSERYLGQKVVFIDAHTDSGLKILYDDPREVGADRIVNGAEAYFRYGGPCVVVDLGTAITFDAVSAGGEYLGGLICPGIGISTAALYSKAARLPMVEIREPAKLIGANTVDSMQSGLYHGYLALIDGILERLTAELGPNTQKVATGGQAAMIARGSRYLTEVNDDLTLQGLERIWSRNHPR